jgi:hypothetical protein
MFNRFNQFCTISAIFVFVICSFTTSYAQMAESQLVSVVNIPAPTKTIYYAPGASPKKDIEPTYARWAKKMSAVYDGFAVQLCVTDFPLSRENALFSQFGQVFYERTAEGKFAYMIAAPKFSNKKSLQDFIDNIMKKRAPEAVAVEFKDGKRK